MQIRSNRFKLGIFGITITALGVSAFIGFKKSNLRGTSKEPRKNPIVVKRYFLPYSFSYPGSNYWGENNAFRTLTCFQSIENEFSADLPFGLKLSKTSDPEKEGDYSGPSVDKFLLENCTELLGKWWILKKESELAVWQSFSPKFNLSFRSQEVCGEKENVYGLDLGLDQNVILAVTTDENLNGDCTSTYELKGSAATLGETPWFRSLEIKRSEYNEVDKDDPYDVQLYKVELVVVTKSGTQITIAEDTEENHRGYGTDGGQIASVIVGDFNMDGNPDFIIDLANKGVILKSLINEVPDEIQVLNPGGYSGVGGC